MRGGRWLGLLVWLWLGPATALADDPPKGGKPAAEVKTSKEGKSANKPAAKPGQKAATAPAAKGGKPAKGTRASGKKASKPPQPAAHKKKPKERPLPKLPGSRPGEPDEAVRQYLTGDYGTAPHRANASPEVETIREVDHILFPPSDPGLDSAAGNAAPALEATGLPAPAPAAPPEVAVPAPTPAWIAALALPDIPVRFTPALVRYLEYYKDDPKGRSLVARFVAKSGRYRDGILRVLRAEKLPDDVMWVALVESGFDPTAYSPVGAAGMWQFMPETGRIYGLTVNRRVDERLDPERSTVAAARHLGDLYTRFGSWELALAAYNMGFGGLLSSIRKYNTNDFWELEALEAALPYETALYVPKILAVAVAARNCAVFGCDGVTFDKPDSFDEVAVGPGISFEAIAAASGAPLETLAALNPQYSGTRTPPLESAEAPRASWTVRVPHGTGAATEKSLGSAPDPAGKLSAHRVRWGETLDRIAAAHGTSRRALERLNDLGSAEGARPGTIVLVPQGGAAAAVSGDRPVVVVPDERFATESSERRFYEVVHGDSLGEVARACGVTAADLARWNHLDARADLQEGMRLQLFLPSTVTPANVVLERPDQFTVLTVGSDEFFAYFEAKKGRKRMETRARDGDTWRRIADRHGMTLGMLERVNHRSRTSRITPGEAVVVYTAATPAELAALAAGGDDAAQNGEKPSESATDATTVERATVAADEDARRAAATEESAKADDDGAATTTTAARTDEGPNPKTSASAP